MPGNFEITTVSNRADWNNQTRQGTVSFTVTNRSGRPIRGLAWVVAEKPETQKQELLKWLKIDGTNPRAFDIPTTDVFRVIIAKVPAQVQVEGTHAFHLEVADNEKPDDPDTGPSVTFDVKNLPRHFPWWLPLLI